MLKRIGLLLLTIGVVGGLVVFVMARRGEFDPAGRSSMAQYEAGAHFGTVFTPFIGSAVVGLLLMIAGAIRAANQPSDPKAPAKREIVAGSTCSKCGRRLILNSEGRIDDHGTVICHDCETA